jgi:hypothetical protein
MRRTGWVIEKTVRKAERALRGAKRRSNLSNRERRVKPASERDFLAGEIPRVFNTPSLFNNHAIYYGKEILASLE